MIYPKGNPFVVGVAPPLNNIYTSPNLIATQQYMHNQQLQQQGGGGGGGGVGGQQDDSSGMVGVGGSSYQQTTLQQIQALQQQQQQLLLQQHAEQQSSIPVEQIQPRLPYHYPVQYYPESKIENPEFIVSTTLLSNQLPPPTLSISSNSSAIMGGGVGVGNCRNCGSKTDNSCGGGSMTSPSSNDGGLISSSRLSGGGPSSSSGSGSGSGSSYGLQGFGSVGASTGGNNNNNGNGNSKNNNNGNSGGSNNGSRCSSNSCGSGKSDNNNSSSSIIRTAGNNAGGAGGIMKCENDGSSGGGGGKLNSCSLKRNMSSSTTDIRMNPRPAKTPAWSFPPLMSIPSPIDDPSSCSDNASDHSDKIESMSHSSSNNNSSNNQQQQQSGSSNHNSSGSHHQKNRKRKMSTITNSFNNNNHHGSSSTGNHVGGRNSHSPTGSENNNNHSPPNSSNNSSNGNGGGGGGGGGAPSGASSSSNSAQASLWADAESLAADFDGSLSGLGADLSSTSYDMSEALLSLPTIYHHNRGLISSNTSSSSSHHNSNNNNHNSSNSSSNNNNNNANNSNSNNNQNSSSPNQSSNSATGSLRTGSGGGGGGGGEVDLTPLSSSQSQHHGHAGSTVSLPGDFHFQNRNSPTFQSGGHQGNSSLDCERRFQYVLAAATSIATKMNEETLTYLNQGQPYEIKLKKCGELTAYRGTVFRTVVRLCFHDRRLQFSEREQIALWEYSHPRDRILQVDLPLSYGVTMLTPTADMSTNAISFLWEPLKEVGLYVKVNCISTEFTPKKHGGEKGVPFRLMIETYSHPDNVRLHAGASQVKVFKLKGADRKHKQDREKIMKKTATEQAKLQPSYECTVLSDISLESLDSPSPTLAHSTGNIKPDISGLTAGGGGSGVGYPMDFPMDDDDESPDSLNGGGPMLGGGGGSILNAAIDNAGGSNHFSAHFTSEAVRRWLVRNRFTATKTLWDFSGLDLLRLNKDELIEMCGLAEGIRLFNALHYKITFFVTLGNRNQQSDIDESNSSESSNDDNTFHPICLSSPSTNEFTAVLNSLFNSSSSSTSTAGGASSSSSSNGSSSSNYHHRQQQQQQPIERLYLSVNANANSKIRVVLNEQLLSTLKDQSAFRVYKNGNDCSLQLIE